MGLSYWPFLITFALRAEVGPQLLVGGDSWEPALLGYDARLGIDLHRHMGWAAWLVFGYTPGSRLIEERTPAPLSKERL